MKLGVIIPLNDKLGEEFSKAKMMGFETCQLTCWDVNQMTDSNAELVNNISVNSGIEISAFWCGWPKPAIWDFYDGNLTLGLVPQAYRYARMETLLAGSNFAKKIGVKHLITHVGFIPENPHDPEYNAVVSVVRHIAKHCKANGQYFLFETGQETPITLKRMIQDVGLDNLAINLDPANLLMYGKANPLDSLDTFGEYVKGLHAKDGEYPTDGRYLGVEKPLGQGRVNFPALLSKLKELGYNEPITIEREIIGEEQIKDIKEAKKLLEAIVRDIS